MTCFVSDDNKVIHSVSPKTLEEDILNFCRTDRICILRPDLSQEEIVESIEKAKKFIGVDYDFGFDSSNANEVYCSETVYEVFKDYKDKLGMFKPVEKLLWLFEKEIIRPRDFIDFPGFKLIKEIKP